MKGKFFLTLSLAVFSLAALAFGEVPRASANALGVTKNSKPIETGLVFVNGKFLPPPYTVARWGTGLRINGKKVTGQIISWDEFLKTQSGVKVERTAPAAVPAAPAAPVELAPEPGSDDDGSLDDLFDDDSSAKKKSKTAKKPRAAAPKAQTATYSLEGEFVANESTKSMLNRINTARNEIDRLLRMGGCVFFGNDYARITGGQKMTEQLLATLPTLLQKSENAKAFMAKVRDNSLVILHEGVCEDLYRNRIDYRALREYADDLRRSREMKSILE